MFESDIERSKLRLIEAVNGYQPSTYLRDIVAHANVDYAYKQYFESEFAWWLYEQQTVRKTNPHVDPDDPETAAILRNLDIQYHKNARFERDQLLSIADAAVKGVLNYRVRPRTTLKWFVYRGEPTKPIHEIYLRMRYFADYQYLHEGFNRWLVQRGLRYDSLDIISVLEFERLVKKIDDDAILDLSPSEFVNMISPIGYCFPPDAGETTDRGIPIEAVIIFLDDKEVYVIAQKLEHMLYQQGIRYLTKDMFLAVVDEVLAEVDDEPRADQATVAPDRRSDGYASAPAHAPAPVPAHAPAPPPVPTRTPPAPFVPSTPTVQGTATTPSGASDTAAVSSAPTARTSELISVQSVRESSVRESVPTDIPIRTSSAPAMDAIPVAPRERTDAAAAAVAATENDESTGTTRADDLSMVTVQETAATRANTDETVSDTVASSADSSPVATSSSDASATAVDSDNGRAPAMSGPEREYPSVTTLYDARQREVFIRKICAGSEDMFTGLTTLIDATTNWKEALAVLDKHYAKQNIDPQSAPARDLRMIIYRRFIAM